MNTYAYVGNNPLANIDPLSLERWRVPDGTHVVGRPGTIVPPGGVISNFIENNVGSGYTLGQLHDPLVELLTSAGVPDVIANVPTMLPTYLWGIWKDGLELPAEQRPQMCPLVEIRF